MIGFKKNIAITDRDFVTLSRWSCSADDPFVCFGAKPNKGLSPRSSTWPEVGKRERESWTKEPTGRIGDGRWRGAVGNRHRTAEETSRHEIGSSSSEGRPVKMSKHSSSFVKISLEIHVSVSLRRHREWVSQLNLLALELTQAHIVRLFIFLSSHSLDCISCSHEEMCDTPFGTTRWSPAKKWNG